MSKTDKIHDKCFSCCMHQIRILVEQDPEEGYEDAKQLLFNMDRLEFNDIRFSNIVDNLNRLLYFNGEIYEVFAELEKAHLLCDDYIKENGVKFYEPKGNSIYKKNNQVKLSKHIEFPLKSTLKLVNDV